MSRGGRRVIFFVNLLIAFIGFIDIFHRKKGFNIGNFRMRKDQMGKSYKLLLLLDRYLVLIFFDKLKAGSIIRELLDIDGKVIKSGSCVLK